MGVREGGPLSVRELLMHGITWMKGQTLRQQTAATLWGPSVPGDPAGVFGLGARAVAGRC